MAVSTKWYIKGIEHALNMDFDVEVDDIKVMMTTESYTPNQNSHEYRSDVTNEVSGTGYTAATLQNPVLSTLTNVVTFDADNVSWTITGSLAARYAVIYVDTGSTSTDILLGYVDFDGVRTTTDGVFNINWNASGILKGTAS